MGRKQGRRTKKKKKGNDNSKLTYLFVVLCLLALVGIYLVSKKSPVPPRPSPLPPPAAVSKKKKEPPQPVLPETLPAVKLPKLPPSAEPPPVKPPGEIGPRLAIIIDDIGNNHRYKDLIEIGIPLTLAIMPFGAFTEESSAYAYARGAEVILHLPMEPKGYPETNPGKGALLLGMTRDQILANLKRGFDAVPHARGLNNHMGSGFTEVEEGMKVVLSDIRNRGLFFVDSRTTVNSKGLGIARALHVKSAERDVFLDNVQEESAIERQLMDAVELAKRNGRAIAIGHPYPATVAVLKKQLPLLQGEGLSFVNASELVE